MERNNLTCRVQIFGRSVLCHLVRTALAKDFQDAYGPATADEVARFGATAGMLPCTAKAVQNGDYLVVRPVGNVESDIHVVHYTAVES